MSTVYEANPAYKGVIRAVGGMRGLLKLTGAFELVSPHTDGDNHVRSVSGEVALRLQDNALGEQFRIRKLLEVEEDEGQASLIVHEDDRRSGQGPWTQELTPLLLSESSGEVLRGKPYNVEVDPVVHELPKKYL